MVTIADIALRVGCANSLVSDVLNGRGRRSRVSEAKRQLIKDIALELGYRPNEMARAVRTGKTNIIGFVSKGLQRGYAHTLLEGVIDGISPLNYSLKIITTNQTSDPERLADQCIRYLLDGVVIYDYDPMESLLAFKDLLRRHNIPLVMAGGDSPLPELVCIKSDLAQGGRLAFEHLHKAGHRRIALLSVLANEPHFIALRKGFAEAAAESGVKIPDRLHFTSPGLRLEIDLRLLREECVTAIFCNSDFQALETLTLCLRHGIRVPDDMAIIGRGNLSFTRCCHPSLSSIDEDLYGMGRRAASLLTEIIAKPDMKPFFEYFPHRLVARESTGCKSAEHQAQGQSVKLMPCQL